MLALSTYDFRQGEQHVLEEIRLAIAESLGDCSTGIFFVTISEARPGSAAIALLEGTRA